MKAIMAKNSRKRVQRRLARLTGRNLNPSRFEQRCHERQFQFLCLIESWSNEYQRRIRRSVPEGENFRRQKQDELRLLGASEEIARRFDSTCRAQRFFVEECGVLAGKPNVPALLVSNYSAIELYELREMRRR